MCEYCNPEEPKLLIDRSVLSVEIMNIFDGIYILDVDYYGYQEGCNEEIKINYCPICGRKLDSDTDVGSKGD